MRMRPVPIGVDEGGLFGLWETGEEESGGHVVLLAKLKRGKPEAGIVFHTGQTVRVRLGSGGDLVQLVISFTTPSRYYRAGDRVTTCLVGTPREAYASQVRGRRGAGGCLSS